MSVLKDGRQPLSKQVKKGLAQAFTNLTHTSCKYNRDGAVKLRDVLFLCHANQRTKNRKLYGNNLLTDAARLIRGKSACRQAKIKATWERLLAENKLGGLALLRNCGTWQEARLMKPCFAALTDENRKNITFRFIAAAKHARNGKAALKGQC